MRQDALEVLHLRRIPQVNRYFHGILARPRFDKKQGG
jgi:hypothetical protein